MMNHLFDSDRALTVYGVAGRLTHRTTRPTCEGGAVWRWQCWISEARPFPAYGKTAIIRATIRFDDGCNNGRNTFAITGEIRIPGQRDVEACGCLHDEIGKAFPELAGLIRWHLVSTDGPMHYGAKAVYLAGDRDYNGLRKGEQKPLLARDGIPHWQLVAVDVPDDLISSTPTGEAYKGKPTVPLFILEKDHKGEQPPAFAPRLEWRQQVITGEGKERELDAARRSAVWPDATDAELMQEPEALRIALAAHLPRLMEHFRADIEAAGFFWAPSDYQYHK